MTLDEAIKYAEAKVDECFWKDQHERELNQHDMFTEYLRMGKQYKQLAEWLRELKAYKEQERWIPVTEKLPEDDEMVLCCYEYFRYGDYKRMFKTYGVGIYDSKYDLWSGDVSGHKLNVIAWMPFPKHMFPTHIGNMSENPSGSQESEKKK